MNRLLPSFLLIALLPGACKQPENAPATGAAAGGAEARAASVPALAAVPAASTGSPGAPVADDDTAINASIDRVLGDHARYQAVIEAYQQAVTRGDRSAVAALVDYPITVEVDGSRTTIRDPAAFVRNYDRIITPAIARAIETQKYSELMVNSKGVMFGDGETWINGICAAGSADCSEFEVKVIAIQAGASP